MDSSVYFALPALRLQPSKSIPSIIAILGLSFLILSYRSSDLRNHAAGIASESLLTGEDLFMSFAALDEGQAAMEEQTSLLLDDALNPSYTTLMWDRLMGTEEEQRLEAALIKLARAGHRVPIKTSESIWRLKRIRTVLHRWMQKRRTYDPTIMFSLLKQVKEPIDRFISKNRRLRKTDALVQLGKPYGSCAVVGNSGILLGSHYGELIDSHDAVIRLNYAQIKKYTEDVGKKTTIAFINSNVLHGCRGESNCFCKPYSEWVPSLMYICQPVHILDADFCSETELILVTDPRLDNLCNRITKYYSVKGYMEAHNVASGYRVGEEDCKTEESVMVAMKQNRSLQSQTVLDHHLSASSPMPIRSHSDEQFLLGTPASSHLSSDATRMQKHQTKQMFHETSNTISTGQRQSGLPDASIRVQMVPESAMERSIPSWSRAHDGPAFHYSSGLQAVVVALGICHNVSLFGFGKSASSQHHYYGPQQKAELPLHDYDAEYRFYRDLQNLNHRNIPFISQSGFPLPPLHIHS